MKREVKRLLLQRTALLFFLLLPVMHMHAQTQAELNAQARKDFAKVDVDLNKTYQEVLTKLPPNEKQKLKEAQRAWVASRDAEGADAVQDAPAYMAQSIRYGAMRLFTEKRIAELNAMIGKETPPAEPSSTPAPTARPTPDPISPDKKWEYKAATDDRGPQIVKAGTNDSAGDLSDACGIGSCGESASVLWAPDSKRVAFHWGQGRTQQTWFYQLLDDHWAPLNPQPDEEIAKRLGNDIHAQLKQHGQSHEKLEKKGLYLRFIQMDSKVDRWTDSKTALVYAFDGEVIAERDDPGEMSDGFSANFVFTVKFDDAGKWKIVNTRRVSEKEARKREEE